MRIISRMTPPPTAVVAPNVTIPMRSISLSMAAVAPDIAKAMNNLKDENIQSHAASFDSIALVPTGGTG